MMPILSDAARTVYALKTDVLARHLSHPDRIDRMRRAFNRLATFPPEVVVPIFMSLRQWASWMPPKAAEGIVTALRDHGELFVSITDALANAYLRNALLPLPEDAAEADAIRALACNDPLSAHRIAHALHDCSWRVALRELLTSPPHHAVAIWRALNNVVRSEIGAVVTAAPLDADPLAVHDPIAVLALAAMESDDADLRDAGADALTMHIGLFRVLWNQLPRDVQQRLHTHFMLSDLPIVPARSADQTGFRRWRT